MFTEATEMAKYDFDTIIDRRHTASYKWDVKDGELPMWVADMDFKAAPEIIDAISERIKHGVFGYPVIEDDWYDALIGWWKARHDFPIEKEWLSFCTGVVPALSSAVRKFTTPAEYVVVLTPVYNVFFNSIVNNGRRILESPLAYKDGAYEIDFADFEKKLSDPQTSLFILCNPHNPVGKIWDVETLGRIGELCAKHGVTVISDEIHCDLTDPGKNYVPFASVSETCAMNGVTCIAPSKTFNIAGLHTAAVFSKNPKLHAKIDRALNTDEVAEPNVFACIAAAAAFTKGGAWLDELRAYIFENKKTVCEFIKKEIPEIFAVPSDATYLLWLDCSKITEDSKELAAFIRSETGLYLTAGSVYGGNGNKFLRMNVACPNATVDDGLARLKAGVRAYCSKRR